MVNFSVKKIFGPKRNKKVAKSGQEFWLIPNKPGIEFLLLSPKFSMIIAPFFGRLMGA